MSSTSDLYEFKMYLFDNGEPEEFSLFVHNFNMTLAASETLEAGVKVQYIRTLSCKEKLRQFDLLSSDVEITKNLNVGNVIKGLHRTFFPVNSLSKQKCVMRRVIRKQRSLKLRFYIACLVELNYFFDFLPEAILSDIIGVTVLNKKKLNSMPNSWIKKAYVQCFG